MRYKNPVRIPMLKPRIATVDLRPASLQPKQLTKPTSAIYGSAEWKALRARLLAERGSICQRCGKRGRVILDHVKELVDGGAPFDPANLVFLCDHCHGVKTADEAMKRNARKY